MLYIYIVLYIYSDIYIVLYIFITYIYIRIIYINTQSNIDTLLLIYQRKKKINLTVNKDRCLSYGYYELNYSTLPTQ